MAAANSKDTREVQRAMESGSLCRMLAVLGRRPDTSERHYLLLCIVQETYRLRKRDPKMRDLCERVAKQHIAEFPALVEALVSDVDSCWRKGELPWVPTFEHLATVLTENRDYDGAVRVCEQAVSFGLTDGTAGDYKGRIARIRRRQEKDQAGTLNRKEPNARSKSGKRTAPAKAPARKSSVPKFNEPGSTEDDLTPRRREFYEKWRSAWRKGQALPVDGNISYLFLYAYNVLGRGPERAKVTLRRLVEAYHEAEPYFAQYCRWWLSDCCVATGDYREALNRAPLLTPGGRSAARTDSLLSLKLIVGERICGRDVLTLNGPRVTKWGKEHLDEVLGFLDVTVPTYEREHEVDLIADWAKAAYSYPYFIFTGSELSRGLEDVRCYSFSQHPSAVEFVRAMTREAENTTREESGLP